MFKLFSCLFKSPLPIVVLPLPIIGSRLDGSAAAVKLSTAFMAAVRCTLLVALFTDCADLPSVADGR